MLDAVLQYSGCRYLMFVYVTQYWRIKTISFPRDETCPLQRHTLKFHFSGQKSNKKSPSHPLPSDTDQRTKGHGPDI